MFIFAHAGHWQVSLLYLLPVLVLGLAVLWSRVVHRHDAEEVGT